MPEPHNNLVDQAVSIRSGEEVDPLILKEYLRQYLSFTEDDLSIRQFPSGFSNLTYLLRNGEKEYVLRRPPIGANIKSAHDMGREFKVLSLLKDHYHLIPAPLHFCSDENILGAPFYIMERVKGIILRNKPPEGMTLTSELMKTISESAVDNLKYLHDIDIESTGLNSLGKPEGYINRQVEGWSKRYINAETDPLVEMNLVIDWMQNNMPQDGKPALIHNDYKYDNLVLNPEDPAEILSVLDWEMATVGDPLMDLGTTLAYWCEEADNKLLQNFNLTWLPGNLTREEVVRRYIDTSGRKEEILFYYVFGAFKIGVIVQQIYARYKKGVTKDPRFANLIHVVKACGQNASNAIQYNRISNFY